MAETSFHHQMATLGRAPLLVEEGQMDLVIASVTALAEHPRYDELMQASLSGNDNFWPSSDDWRAQYRPYNVKDGVLQIPVLGVLFNRFSYQLGSFATGYTYIEKALQRGLDDPEVQGIAFLVDSPGGEAAGVFELTDKVFDARGKKPLRAFAADMAYSAAFSIASGAEQIIATRSAGLGSVGVINAHVEISEALKARGITVTLIIAGEKKADGHPAQPLSERAKAAFQDRVDKIYGVFVSTVGRNRGMSTEAVRGTQAGTYDAEGAIAVGFADRIGALDEEVALFSAEVSSNEFDPDQEDEMTDKTTEKDKAKDAAAQDAAAQAAQAAETARKDAIAAERKRIGEITSLDEAKGREELAMKLATTTDLSAEQCKDLLAASGKPAVVAEPDGKDEGKDKGKDKAKGSHFDAAMASGNPEVGSGDADDDEDEEETGVKSLVGAYSSATNMRPKSAKTAA